jgi:hypothetical protein
MAPVTLLRSRTRAPGGFEKNGDGLNISACGASNARKDSDDD